MPKIKIKELVERELDLKTLRVIAPIDKDSWCDALVNGEEDIEGKIPLRSGDEWCIDIDLDTGIIKNWPKGTTAETYYKLCDSGKYYILDSKGDVVKKIIYDYVPRVLRPNEWNSDYIMLNICEDGSIVDFNGEDIKLVFIKDDE